MIMIRMPEGIHLFTDGMVCRSQQDPVLSGMVSKPVRLTHMPAVIAMTGQFGTLRSALAEHEREWPDFDAMLVNFRQAIGEQIEQYLRYSDDTEIGCRYLLGGYSPARKRWESHALEVYSLFEDPWQGIGELTPAPEVAIAPVPDAEALQRYGFDPAHVEFKNMDEGPIDLMRAMRATTMEFGYRSDPDGTPGHMVGCFIEETWVGHGGILSRLVWEWPEDRVGSPIDASHEGSAIHYSRAENETRATGKPADRHPDRGTAEPVPAPEPA